MGKLATAIKPGIRLFKGRPRMSAPRALAFGFAGVIFLGALLLTLPVAANPGKTVSFINALFTATSAVCVTGLVATDTLNTFSTFGQVVILLLIQVGGLGFMSLATLVGVVMGKKILLREKIILQEALNKSSIDGVVRLALYVLKLTMAVELSGAVILAFAWSKQLGWGKAVYYGVFHSVSAFNNAGFDLFGNYSSLTSQVGNLPVNLVISGLIIIGGLGFTVIADLHQARNWKQLSLHSKLVITTTLGLLIFGFCSIALLEWNNPETLGSLSVSGKLIASWFQSVSPRTAGFNTIDLTKSHEASLLLIIILMFIGASPGSTGGGIKTSTFAATLLAVFSLIKGSGDFNVGNRRLSKEQVIKGAAIAFIAMSLVITVAVVLSAVEGLPILATMFEATSAFGTVGLSLGVTPGLSLFGKLIIIFTMFAGRLGPLTLAIALGQTDFSGVRYPEEKIIIG